jgi:hypothetical protein
VVIRRYGLVTLSFGLPLTILGRNHMKLMLCFGNSVGSLSSDVVRRQNMKAFDDHVE